MIWQETLNKFENSCIATVILSLNSFVSITIIISIIIVVVAVVVYWI